MRAFLRSLSSRSGEWAWSSSSTGCSIKQTDHWLSFSWRFDLQIKIDQFIKPLFSPFNIYNVCLLLNVWNLKYYLYKHHHLYLYLQQEIRIKKIIMDKIANIFKDEKWLFITLNKSFLCQIPSLLQQQTKHRHLCHFASFYSTSRKYFAVFPSSKFCWLQTYQIYDKLVNEDTAAPK